MSKNCHTLRCDLKKITLFTLIAVFFWTLFNISVIYLNIKKIQKYTAKNMTDFGREFFHKDILYRRWNASLGGVYGEITENSPPNPYLIVDEQNITTPNGKKLTMINPAYMTRLVHEIALQDSNIIGHITSLNPIRPANKADDWEKFALQSFQNGKKEIAEIVDMNGNEYFRYMAPLFVEQSCLQCHQYQGYKLGDLRGGISVSIPYVSIKKDKQQEFASVILSFGTIWFLGVIFVFGFAYNIRKNITERHRLNNEILQNEKDYRHFFNNMLSGCIVLRPDNNGFTIKAINKKALEIDDIKIDNAINKSSEILIPRNQNEALYGHISEVCTSQKSFLLPEIKFTNNKNITGWREFQIFCTESKDIVLVYFDRTLEHFNEEQMIVLSRAVEQSTSLIAITDLNGNLEFANPMFLKTTGYSWHEIKGQNARILKSNEQSKEFYKNMWEKILSGETWYGEFHNKTKSGQFYWESSNISPIYNKTGELTHFVKIGKDITEARLAIESLKESESRYRNLVESSYDAMLLLHEDEIIYFNHAFEMLTGYNREELLSKKFNQLIDKSKLHNEILGTGIRRSEAVMRRADNTTIEVEIIKTTIEYSNKKSSFLIIRDITKQAHILKTLQETIERTKSLDGLIPICASCKSIRDEEKSKTTWVTPEEYIHERLPNVDFTHSICPSCLKSMYPELYEIKFGNKSPEELDQ